VKLVCGQRNDDWIVILASSLKELGRAVVRIAEDLMRECFTGAPYDDAFAFTGPGYHCKAHPTRSAFVYLRGTKGRM
jgi:hypothetical protein